MRRTSYGAGHCHRGHARGGSLFGRSFRRDNCRKGLGRDPIVDLGATTAYSPYSTTWLGGVRPRLAEIRAIMRQDLSKEPFAASGSLMGMMAGHC